MHATARVASLFRVASSLRWLSHPIYLGSTQFTPNLNIPKPSMGTLDEIFDQRDLNKYEIWPGNTPAVLKALADECLKATFFEIGKHATWHPEITKQVINAGMTVGTHTWSHKDLARNPYAKDINLAEQEIEMGISAVHMAAAGGPVAPFFRFPDLQHPSQLLEYLAQRNIGIFSTDINSRDFKIHKPEQVIKSVMGQLEKRGKGIILMHDFQRNTAETLPQLLQQLKAGGYKVVHMVPKGELTTVPKYDEMLAHEDKLSSNNTRPENSVVRTIGE